MNKKAAVELSVNFIVITVLSLIVMGIGFYLVTNIFTTATDYKESLDEQTKESIISVLKKSGEPISLPITSYNIFRGNANIIGVGLYNALEAEETFHISVDCKEALAADETVLCEENNGNSCAEICDSWPILDTETVTLEPKKSTAIGIFVKVPEQAASGTYGFTFKVCTENVCGITNSEQYATTKKFYVTVPE